jgi:hypothetical protein
LQLFIEISAVTPTKPLTISISMKTLLFTAAEVTLIVLGAVNAAQAEILTVPNNLSSIEGNADNSLPFSTETRYQQVFAASEFAFLSEPALITKISFRPDAIYGEPFSARIRDIQLALSTTNAAVDRLSQIFANNIGSDETIVYRGALSLSSAFIGSATGPKAFDVSINLQNPFLYDPNLGNLLLDVTNFLYNSEVFSLDAQNEVGDSISRRYTYVSNSPAAVGSDDGDPRSFGNSTGLVTQFTITPIPKPVPESSSILGLSIIGFTALITKKKLASVNSDLAPNSRNP